MKARRIDGIDPAGGLADNAQRIVETRLDEVYSFVPAALDPAEVDALHDMRIAAKRLRYVLEVTAGPCFGPYAEEAAGRARDLQDVIGEIHDCDVALPRVRRIAADGLAEDAAELVARADGAEDLDPELATGLPHALEHRGLATLETYLTARRALLYERFLVLWQDLGREGFRARLEFALRERPHAPDAPGADGTPVQELGVGDSPVGNPAFTPDA